MSPLALSLSSRLLLSWMLLALVSTRLSAAEDPTPVPFDCSVFDYSLVADNMAVTMKVFDNGTQVAQIKCKKDNLLVPVDATTVFCDNETGWNLPECIEIPRVSFANGTISHDVKNPKLNILVHLSKKVVREFTVTVTPIHSDDVLAAVTPDHFILNNDKLIFKKKQSVQSVSLTIVDSHMSGINKKFTLCLGVEANAEETRAKVTTGTKRCVNVTIVNSNVAKLSFLQSHYVFTASDQMLSFSVGYRTCDILVTLCIPNPKLKDYVTPNCQGFTLPRSCNEWCVVDLMKQNKSFSFNVDMIGRHKAVLSAAHQDCQVHISDNEVIIDWTMGAEEIKAHTSEVSLNVGIHLVDVSLDNTWQPGKELIQLSFKSPIVTYGFELQLSAISGSCVDTGCSDAIDDVTLMVEPGRNPPQFINISHLLVNMVDTSCALMDQQELCLEVATSPFVAIVTPGSTTCDLVVSYKILVNFSSTEYAQVDDTPVRVTVTTSRCVNSQYITVSAKNRTGHITALDLKRISDTKWDVVGIPTQPLQVYTLEMTKLDPPSDNIHIVKKAVNYTSGVVIQFIDVSYTYDDGLTLKINASRNMAGYSLDKLVELVSSEPNLLEVTSTVEPKIDGRCVWEVPVAKTTVTDDVTVNLTLLVTKETDLIKIGGNNVIIVTIPAEALLPSNTPISSTTAEGSWFTGTIAVLIGAVIVAVVVYVAYSKRDQDKRLHLKEAKVKELTEQNTELQRKHHAVQPELIKYQKLAESLCQKNKGLESQLTALRKEVELMKGAEQKSCSQHGAVEVRLNRALEEAEKYKTELATLKAHLH